MNIFGNEGGNPFDQALNTYDNVDFTRVDVSGAIIDNSQLATKLYVDTHGGGGGGNMTYTGTTPATNYIYKALASDGKDAIKSSITDDGTNCIVSATNGITASKLIKSGGTNIQYLMGDGSTLTQSATSGNSNYYLYNNTNSISDITPIYGEVIINSNTNTTATFVYISHISRDNIDVEVYWQFINKLTDLYLQDQSSSTNYVRYNISGTPIHIDGDKLIIPVIHSSSNGTGSTAFGGGHNILVAYFTNTIETDQRLSTLEDKTQNQTAVAYATSFTGQTNFKSILTPYNQNLIIDNGTLVNTISSYAYNETQLCALEINSLGTEFNGAVTVNNPVTASSFIKSGGLATEFLKADGNVDSNSYVSQSGLYNPTGLGNIDIMLRDSPYIGLQYSNGSGINSTLSNSTWGALGVTSSVGSTYALTNNFTRQLCSAVWSFPSPSNGQVCGYGATVAQISLGFNFGLSAILGIADSAYNANNCQNFWGLWNLAGSIPLNQATQLSVQRNMICFGSDTNDPNICIYTGGASNTVKQVDLGASFPANRPSGALSTDWFKFTLYWDLTKIYYKAHNTTTHVIVSGSFTPLVADIPATSINLYPQCARVMGTPQSTGQARLQVQRFGVYYN